MASHVCSENKTENMSSKYLEYIADKLRRSCENKTVSSSDESRLPSDDINIAETSQHNRNSIHFNKNDFVTICRNLASSPKDNDKASVENGNSIKNHDMTHKNNLLDSPVSSSKRRKIVNPKKRIKYNIEDNIPLGSASSNVANNESMSSDNNIEVSECDFIGTDKKVSDEVTDEMENSIDSDETCSLKLSPFKKLLNFVPRKIKSIAVEDKLFKTKNGNQDVKNSAMDTQELCAVGDDSDECALDGELIYKDGKLLSEGFSKSYVDTNTDNLSHSTYKAVNILEDSTVRPRCNPTGNEIAEISDANGLYSAENVSVYREVISSIKESVEAGMHTTSNPDSTGLDIVGNQSQFPLAFHADRDESRPSLDVKGINIEENHSLDGRDLSGLGQIGTPTKTRLEMEITDVEIKEGLDYFVVLRDVSDDDDDKTAKRRIRHRSRIKNNDMRLKARTLIQCQICKETVQRGDLVKHAKSHPGLRPYKCIQCSFTSDDLGIYRRHCRQHTGIRPFKCHLCNFSSVQQCNLKQHMSIHTKIKPFTCPYLDCEYKASRAGHLNKHVLQHTGEKPNKCTMCDYSCAHSSGLKQHIMAKHEQNKSFKCPDCDFRSYNQGSLNKHIRKHSVSKPHVCPQCHFSTAYQGALKRHSITHNADKPFSCFQCLFTTHHFAAVKRHILTQHKEVSENFVKELNANSGIIRSSHKIGVDIEKFIDDNFDVDIETDSKKDIKKDNEVIEEDVDKGIDEDIEKDIDEDIERDVDKNYEYDVETDIDNDIETDTEKDFETDDHEMDIAKDVKV